jgi:hypothetical protein
MRQIADAWASAGWVEEAGPGRLAYRYDQRVEMKQRKSKRSETARRARQAARAMQRARR